MPLSTQSNYENLIYRRSNFQGSPFRNYFVTRRTAGCYVGKSVAKEIEKRGPNPELLFAVAYSACYHGALGNAAKKLGIAVENSTVRALVSLTEDDSDGFRLGLELLRSLAPRQRRPWRDFVFARHWRVA